MLKIHLAQILFNPAYYDPPVDLLEEPSFLNENDSPLGRLRSHNEIASFLENAKRAYIEHIRIKLLDIAKWSGSRGCVFR